MHIVLHFVISLVETPGDWFWRPTQSQVLRYRSSARSFSLSYFSVNMIGMSGLNESQKRLIPAHSLYEEAAVSILRSSKAPLSIAEILERMFDANLVKVTGKTPEKSLYIVIRRANARRLRRGEVPLFIRHQSKANPRFIVYELATKEKNRKSRAK